MVESFPPLVIKVGGAGSADAASAFANAERVIEDHVSILAVSGPSGPAGRVTDLALEAVAAYRRDGEYESKITEITDRLVEHAEGFDTKVGRLAINTGRELRRGLEDGRGSGWMVMAGERYMAGAYVHILREYGRHAKLLNPTPMIRRDRHGAIEFDTSATMLAGHLHGNAIVVMPGTPGVDEDLRVVPVTPELRGFTDITGMIAAEALQRRLGRQVIYQIIKDDVHGILRMPPGLGRQPEIAPSLSVVEAETLSAAGSQVVHSAVLGLLQKSDVRLQVCSGDRSQPGTTIERHREVLADEQIAGIALQQAVAYTVNDIQIEHQRGVTADMIQRLDLPLIDIATGRGVVSMYVTKANHDSVADTKPAAFKEAYGELFSLHGANRSDGLTIVTFVGEALKDPQVWTKTAQEIVAIGAQQAVDVSVPAASPVGNTIYTLVPTKDAETYAVAVYDHFFPSETTA